MTPYLKLQLDLLIERTSSDVDFRSKYEWNYRPLLLRVLESRGGEKAWKIDDVRAVVVLAGWPRFHPFHFFFSPSLPTTKTRQNGLKSRPETK